MEQQEASRLYRVLRKVDFLQHMSVAELGDLVDHLQRVTRKKGEVVVRQGDPGDSFFLISQGRVSIWAKNTRGKNIAVGALGPEQFFGEMALLTGEPRTATVVCDEPAELYMLTKTDFNITLRGNPSLVNQMNQTVSRRRAQLKMETSRETFESAGGGMFSRLKDFLGLRS